MTDKESCKTPINEESNSEEASASSSTGLYPGELEVLAARGEICYSTTEQVSASPQKETESDENLLSARQSMWMCPKYLDYLIDEGTHVIKCMSLWL